MKITKEQILYIEKTSTYEVSRKLKEWFPKAFETVLEVGKWYRQKTNMCDWLMNYQGETNTCFGFNSVGNWGNEYLMEHSAKWKEATQEEVFEALKSEAVKRGLMEGVYYKTPVNEWDGRCGKDFSFDHDINMLFSGGRSIFNKGKWAEIIPTITIQEAEKQLGKKII